MTLNVHDLSIASRLKAIRLFRHMTQKDLGISCGFNASNAGQRIHHYENGIKHPGYEMIQLFAKALSVNPYALSPFTILDATETFEILLWIEGLQGLDFINFDEKWDNTDNWIYRAVINQAQHGTSKAAGLIFKNQIINDGLYEWSIRRSQLLNNEISKDQYINWKLLWPASEDQWITSGDYLDWRTFGLKPDQII